MNLLILGPTTGHSNNPAYRGADRAVPSYCDALPEDHEINRLFYWYLEEGGEYGLVHDFAKARRFAELWDQQPGGDRYEVVEVTEGNGASVGGGKFLGFDMSAGYGNSFLGGGVLSMVPTQARGPGDPLSTLHELLIAHFAPRLNSNALFTTYDDAEFCLRVIRALNNLWPNSFEGTDLSEFHVVGLYKLWPK